MAEVKNYSCKNCGAGLAFEPASGKWTCEYCRSSFDQEELNDQYGDIGATDLHEAFHELESYHCESCGAQLIADDTTTATFCMYCRNPVVIKAKFKGEFTPKYVIPFKLTKNQAEDIYRTWITKKLFAPVSFKQKDEIEKITGIYAPFWLFDCDVDTRLVGKGTKISTWRTGNTEYTKTQYFHVERDGHVKYEKVPVDAATKLDDTFMKMIEPYDYSELKEFTLHFLTGFMAERYDVEVTESEAIMKNRVEEYATKRVRETINGYNSFNLTHSEKQTSQVIGHYGLLPVYVLVNKFNDKEHQFLINGQTGKIVGDTPIDHKRQWLFFGAVSAITCVVLLIGGVFFG
jgi:DNA-directed RNA polymerase subunit RPC12/RpoP